MSRQVIDLQDYAKSKAGSVSGINKIKIITDFINQMDDTSIAKTSEQNAFIASLADFEKYAREKGDEIDVLMADILQFL